VGESGELPDFQFEVLADLPESDGDQGRDEPDVPS
jgi:hypothetical protein